jgi:hypothetical protein
MRSLAITALLGSFAASGLLAQSLTEHAAAAAGATIGTAAGKPLGTALGKIFGEVDKSSSTAATPKTAKPVAITKPSPAAAPAPSAPALTSGHSSSSFASGDSGGSGSGSSGGSSEHASRRAARRRVEPDDPEAGPAPTAPTAPEIAEPVVVPAKEPTVEEVAAIKLGATSSEVNDTLGVPQSRVSIPGDDGHLLEICQYWAKGGPIGTVRLDNGRVISVQANN